ncbi:MAG: hypothetical protein KKA16_02240 [Alphaproteobacteria bacterium]|nr:hypothetical protein [Alphaproteobacteria bacterium]MBU2380777.1 hypothetical protein [Alphaproteobacteria bacterium]
MIRNLSSLAIAVTVGATLAACQPGPAPEGGEGRPSLPASGEPMPAGYDWHFVAHGGSGDLDFGDGDWAEGVSVFHLSCLPASRSVEMSWGYPGEAVLTSGTATGTFRADSSAATNHPVFAALKSSAAIAVGLSGADMVLSAKPEGRAELAAFYDYCDTGVDPRAVPETAPEPEAPTEAAPEADAGEIPVAEAPAPDAEIVPEP